MTAAEAVVRGGAAADHDGITGAGGSCALYATDGREYDPARKIADALKLYVRGQGASCAGLRCLRVLYRPDGTPILSSKGEPLRAVLAGIFDLGHLEAAAELAADLEARPADAPSDNLGHPGAVGKWQCTFTPNW